MTYKSAIELLKTQEFPLNQIKKKIEGLGNHYSGMRLSGILTIPSSHLAGREKHISNVVQMVDKFQGFDVLHRYMFCPICGRYIFAQSLIFNDVENSVFIIDRKINA